MKDLTPEEPGRAISTATDADVKKIQQETYDIKYKVGIEEHVKRVRQLEENKTKAYAMIWQNYCS